MPDIDTVTGSGDAASAESEVFATSTFDELPLSPETREGIRARGYERPTPVQAATIRPVLAGRDVIVRSKTGTGKTAAFGIPLVEKVEPGRGVVQALVLCNTRELAFQVAGELGDLGKFRGVKVAAIYGGASMDDQLRALADGATIVVGTPGRLLDLLERRTLSLAEARVAVLDEADEMLSEGFYEDVLSILRRLPQGHQTLLFSATVSPDTESIIRTHLKEPETILLSGDHYSVEGIRNITYFARDEYPKPRNLLYMMQLENPENGIVFCNTRDDVNLICSVLDRAGYDADKISGELSQSERERAMARVKRGELRFLVATDIAARGIDISDLSHVINYSLPEDPSVYLHRAGRTGRIGKKGTALSLVRGPELVTLSALEKRFGVKFEERKLPLPEEAHRMWTESHVQELRAALGTRVFESFIPLAQELKAREGGEILIAFALKYFFTHHRMERLAAARRAEEQVGTRALKEEHKGRLRERRSERTKPKLEAPEPRAKDDSAPGEHAPAPKGGRLFVTLGTGDGMDADSVRAAFLSLTGLEPEAVRSVEIGPRHTYVDVAPEAVDRAIAASGKTLGDKAVSVEVARPRTSHRRRR